MNDRVLYPPIEPYRVGRLRVSEIHEIVYEEVGNMQGKPLLYLHGGPGYGIIPEYRQFFDPKVYRGILPDQRGAGRSTPSGGIQDNTTWLLVDDLEVLRERLGIERWVVMGGSWGSTLALCYAIRHPERVSGLIVRGIWLVRPFEIEWLFEGGGAANVFPDEWERFYAPVAGISSSGVVSAYMDLLTNGAPDVMVKAAKSWSRWEASMGQLARDEVSLQRSTRDDWALAKARIECHYAHNKFFMETDNYILENINRICDIPCRIVQGRHDVICPTISAWELSKAVSKSTLTIVPDGSHSPLDPSMVSELVRVTDEVGRNMAN